MYLGCYFDSIITAGEISCLRNRHGAAVSLPRSDRHPRVEREGARRELGLCWQDLRGSGKRCAFSCLTIETSQASRKFRSPSVRTHLTQYSSIKIFFFHPPLSFLGIFRGYDDVMAVAKRFFYIYLSNPIKAESLRSFVMVSQ